MALAPLAHVIFTRVMNYDASDPDWPDRDRFILSNGHASILLYSYLYLTGFGLDLNDLKAFRQLGSTTPGHPEAGDNPGVEVTTGPLGQGFGNAVGMAIAERYLRSRFGEDVCDHFVYVFCGDGDLMEGLSHESASLAGHLGLGRLIAIYDDNQITIDGATSLAFSDDTAARFEAYGWHVNRLGDCGEDLDALENALRAAKEVTDRPSLLVVRTHIATPSPQWTDDPAAHGYALTDDAIRATKDAIGLPDVPFYVTDEVVAYCRAAGARGATQRDRWLSRLEEWQGDEVGYEACLFGTGVPDWEAALPTWAPTDKPLATRVASEACLNALAPLVPGLIGGSADLTGNTGTLIKGEPTQSVATPAGRQIHFGVREHAMAAALVGMARHGGTVPFGGTFFVFSDYMKPAIRLAALSRAKAIFIFTHDSIGVGEDGPTHQPIEQLAGLRAIPGLTVIRPADANETAWAWGEALRRDGPTALILSRQALPVLEGTAAAQHGVQRGAYILREADNGEPELVLLSTGSEVSLCLAAATELEAGGVATRVVSFPSWELFEEQNADYVDDVLPPEVPVLAVEAASGFGWERWADDVHALDGFGASGPADKVAISFGFTAKAIAARGLDLLEALEEG